MVCSVSRVKLLKSIALTLLVAGLTVAQALAAAAPRPATVPQNFVITPFGYYHPSCINHLAQGDVLRQDIKAIQRANGATENIEQCAYPHYRADGQKVIGDETAPKDPPNISHAWIEYASITTTGAYGQIYTEWEVPPSPTSNDGQTVYLFNGMEDSHDVVTIIQPVLGWNSDYSAAWSIAAWNCCVNGQVNEATPAHTNPGDHLEGYVFMNCTKGTRVCSSWDIVIVDEESGAFSELLDTSNYSQQFNWAFGGVLEVYNIAQCTDYPPPDYAGGIGFHNESVLNAQFAVVSNPAWTVTDLASGLTPACNYGGSLPKQVTLTY